MNNGGQLQGCQHQHNAAQVIDPTQKRHARSWRSASFGVRIAGPPQFGDVRDHTGNQNFLAGVAGEFAKTTRFHSDRITTRTPHWTQLPYYWTMERGNRRFDERSAKAIDHVSQSAEESPRRTLPDRSGASGLEVFRDCHRKRELFGRERAERECWGSRPAMTSEPTFD